MILSSAWGIPPRAVDREPWRDCRAYLEAYYEQLAEQREWEAAVHGKKLKR